MSSLDAWGEGGLVSYITSVPLTHTTGPPRHGKPSRSDFVNSYLFLTDNSVCSPWLLCSFIILINLIISHRKNGIYAANNQQSVALGTRGARIMKI